MKLAVVSGKLMSGWYDVIGWNQADTSLCKHTWHCDLLDKDMTEFFFPIYCWIGAGPDHGCDLKWLKVSFHFSSNFLHFILLFLLFHYITELINTSKWIQNAKLEERPNTIQNREERLVTLRSDVGIRHVNIKNVQVQFLNIPQHKLSMNLICSIMLILKKNFLEIWFFLMQ